MGEQMRVYPEPESDSIRRTVIPISRSAAMSRRLIVAVAQSGPIHRSDSVIGFNPEWVIDSTGMRTLANRPRSGAGNPRSRQAPDAVDPQPLPAAMEHRGLRFGEDAQAPEYRGNSPSLANYRDEISGSDRHRRRGAGVRDGLAPGRPGRSRTRPAPALSLGARRTGAAPACAFSSPCRATRKISTSPWKEIRPDTPCGAICRPFARSSRPSNTGSSCASGNIVRCTAPWCVSPACCTSWVCLRTHRKCLRS